MSASTAPFHELLRQAVEGYAGRTGMKKRVIAEACGYSPGMLSHMMSGKRRPGSRQAVLYLAGALELRREEADRLLAALDYSLLTDAEVNALQLERHIAEVSAEALPQAERDLLTQVIDRDLQLVSSAWRRYVDLRDELQRRNWPRAQAQGEEARGDYRGLLAVGPRFAAWLEFAEAEARHHQGQLEDAKAACQRGLAAARLSVNTPALALLTVKLGDIAKLQGNFAGAEAYYLDAQNTLAGWEPPTLVERRFADHWRARIQREQGNLLLFMAMPREAETLLLESYEYLASEGRRYGQAQVCHSLGWATHLLGDWDASLAWRERAIALHREVDKDHGWQDPIAALQDHLYLGLLLEDQGEFQAAERELLQAQAVPAPEPPSWQYHEAGLVHLALSRVYRAPWEKRDLTRAHECARRGLDFYSRMQTRDPVRMAIAHNTYGDLLLDSGQVSEARMEFEQALAWSQSCNPPNQYYEASARLRRCRALLAEADERRKRLEQARQLRMNIDLASSQRDAAEGVWSQEDEVVTREVEAELAIAEELCQERGYSPLMAELKLTHARLRRRRGSREQLVSACFEALEAALSANRFVLHQTWEGIQQLAGVVEERDWFLGHLGERAGENRENLDKIARDASLVDTMLALVTEGAR